MLKVFKLESLFFCVNRQQTLSLVLKLKMEN